MADKTLPTRLTLHDGYFSLFHALLIKQILLLVTICRTRSRDPFAGLCSGRLSKLPVRAGMLGTLAWLSHFTGGCGGARPVERT